MLFSTAFICNMFSIDKHIIRPRATANRVIDVAMTRSSQG